MCTCKPTHTHTHTHTHIYIYIYIYSLTYMELKYNDDSVDICITQYIFFIFVVNKF